MVLRPLLLLSLLLAVGCRAERTAPPAPPAPPAPHPAARHIGRWSAPPTMVPSDYFTDAPIVGSGDLGVAASALQGPLTLHLAANGYWSSAVWVDLPASQFTTDGDEFYSMTNIGSVFLSAPAGKAAWSGATQELYAARVNVSTTAPLIGNASVFALLVNDTDVAAGLNSSRVTGPDNSGVNLVLLDFVPTSSGQITLHLNAPVLGPSPGGGAPPLPCTSTVSAAGVQAALTRDATTSVHNSACMQRCGLGGQRNTSQLWSGLDGSVGLSNSGRCLQAVPAAAGFTGERLIIGDPTNSTNSCAWRLVVPPYARAPNGSEQLVPHLIIGQPPNSTDHCTSEATCVEEALERCRAKSWCTAVSVFPSDLFIEYSNITSDLGLPNPDWETYYRSPPPAVFRVISNGTHCAGLRNGSEPYLVPVADCANAANFVWVSSNGSILAQNGRTAINVWSCLGAVEPNPVVRATVAAKVLSGASVTSSETDHQYWANVTLSVTAGVRVELAVAVPVVNCGETVASVAACDTLGLAQKVLQQVSGSGGAQLVRALHSNQWQAFWAAMQVDLGPQYDTLEKFYYGMQYQAGSALAVGKAPPGLWGPWLTSASPGWRGDYTTDYNYQAAYFGLFSDNRPELANPFFDNVELFWKDLGTWRASMPTWGSGSATRGAGNENSFWAREQLSSSGHDRVTAGYAGIQLPSHWSIFPYGYFGSDWGIQAIAAMLAKPFIDYYDFTGDTAFMRQRAYPLVRAVVDFYVSYAVFKDNAYDILFACAQETCAQAGSESGSLRASNNTIYDLAFARRVLRTVLEWSSTLHIDLDKQPLWTHVLENLAPYPTATSETGATVFAQANFTDGIPSAKNPECARYPIVYFNAMHPGEDIDLAANPDLVNIARSTVELVNKYNWWSPTNGMCLAWPSASRVANNATHLLQNFQTAAGSTMMNNLLPYIVNHPDSGYGCNMENSGATVAINDLLASVHGHGNASALRIFPAGWPTGQPVSFRNVRTKGAFQVSASAIGAGDGVPVNYQQPIQITSLAGTLCTLWYPFGSTVTPVVRTASGSIVPTTNTSAGFQFVSTAGTTYTVAPQ